MATQRAELVDPDRPAFYHLVSRCVRRSWLCGIDRAGGRNFDHRKAWLEQRLLKLSACYAVELFGFAIMSNHFHLIVRFDPLMASRWTDEDVAERWSAACSYSAALSKEDQSLRRQQRFEGILHANKLPELYRFPPRARKPRPSLQNLLGKTREALNTLTPL